MRIAVQNLLPAQPEASAGPFSVLVGLIHEVTGGAYAVVEHTLEPPRRGDPARKLELYAQAAYVLAGEVAASAGCRIVHAAAGSLIHQSWGSVATFWNVGGAPALVLELAAPGGYESFFAALDKLLRESRSREQSPLAVPRERGESTRPLNERPSSAVRADGAAHL